MRTANKKVELKEGRILALDYGSKRIGVALSDESKKIAFVKPYILMKEKEKLLDLIKEEGIEEIILGLPKNLSGGETKSAIAARNFGDWIKRTVRLPIKFIDERFSTREARNKLQAVGIKSKAAKTEIDSMSAYILLESYLRKN